MNERKAIFRGVLPNIKKIEKIGIKANTREDAN